MPNIFVVPPSSSAPFKPTSKPSQKPKAEPQDAAKRYSLDGEALKLQDPPRPAAGPPRPKGRAPAPPNKQVPSPTSGPVSKETDQVPPYLRLGERHSTSSLPRLPPKRDTSELARHSSPLPFGSSSKPSSRSNSPQLGETSRPQTPVKRRVLPTVPANTPPPEPVVMRNKPVRSPSDPQYMEVSRKPQYPIGRNPPDGSSQQSPRTPDGGLKYDMHRESARSPQRDLHQRRPQVEFPWKNVREEQFRSTPDFHRSLSNLHASHRKPDTFHMSQDSLDGVGLSHRGPSDVNRRPEYRGSLYGAPSPRERDRSSNMDAPSSVRSPYASPSFSAHQSSPSWTLPRRPHSTYDDPALTTPGHYGSLQRPTSAAYSGIKQDGYGGGNIPSQPTRPAPTTVNQILYGSAGPASRTGAQLYPSSGEVPSRPVEDRRSAVIDGESRGSPPRITSGMY